jgi:hypothetical protein
MSDSKTDSKQMDGLNQGADGTDEDAKKKSRSAKEKPKASTKRDTNKNQPATEMADGYSSARRVWPD